MQRYIEQLIDDLRSATGEAPSDPFISQDISDEEALSLELEESERIVSGPFEPLSDIVGIAKKLLPSPEKLSQTQIKQLLPEVFQLLQAYNFFFDYPHDAPPEMIYKALYAVWDDEFPYVQSGQFHIELCNSDEENCPFPGYCDYCEKRREYETEIPANEFNVKANDLNEDEENIEQDFDQIEQDYYHEPEITDEEGFVPGIHNYCDRWCERCDFTDKCRLFELEQEMKEFLLQRDDNPDQAEASNGIDQNLGIVGDDGIESDIDFEYEEEDFSHKSDDYFSSESKAARHPLAAMANSYTLSSLDWFRVRDKELAKHFTAQLAHGNADELMDADEVMRWYHLLIFTKLKRALTGYYEIEEFEPAYFDMNGSAKVALIGLDRSIDATQVLLRYLKTHRETIKGFREQLEKIRLMAEEIFPDAREFIRPGLDEM